MSGPFNLNPISWFPAARTSTTGGQPTFSTVAWLAAGMSWATLPFIGRIPWLLLGFVLIIGSWRLHIAWHHRPAPGKAIRHVLSLGVLAVLWATGNVGFGLDAAAPLFVAFLWIKLLELDAERDVLMAAFLGFFLVTGVLLTGQSLVLTAQAMIAAIVILCGIMWYHSPHLGGAAAVDGSTTTPVAAAAGTRRASPGWRAVSETAGRVLILLAQALPFAIVLFLFTPRPVIQLSINTRGAMAGISDRMDPGKFASNAKNEQVAFRAEFPNHDMPFIDDLYWRGVVLWLTDGNAWVRGPEAVPTPRGWVTRVMPATTADGRLGEPPRHRIVQDITLPANPNPWIYTLDPPRELVNEAQTLPGLVMEWRDGPVGTTTYRAVSDPSLRAADWGSLQRRYSLALPNTIDPRIRAQAREFVTGATSNDEVVDRAVEWFSTKGFSYSLEPGEMGPNATATFLFDKRKGYCAHYAGALCVLMRAAGVPARVVLGYRGGEINSQGGFLVVRQSNAHAWAEVWTGSELTGWRRVDLTSVIPATDPSTGQPTAASAAQATSSTAKAAERAARPWYEQLLFSTRTYYEFIESRWDRWAIGYNSEVQEQLLGWLGLDDFGGWAHGIGLLMGGMVVIVSIGLTTWLTPHLRAFLKRTVEEQQYLRFCRRCARVGIVRGPAEGPRDHAERLVARYPQVAGPVRQGIAAWLRLHYGPSRPTAELAADRAALAAATAVVAGLAVPGG